MAAFAEAELVDFLNRMLEAERAGARALVVFMDDWPRNGAEWTTLRRIHEDEAHNCALIGGELKRRGRDYSHATGDFFQKATSIQDKKERIAFLIKGLKWAIRKFERSLLRRPAEVFAPFSELWGLQRRDLRCFGKLPALGNRLFAGPRLQSFKRIVD